MTWQCTALACVAVFCLTMWLMGRRETRMLRAERNEWKRLTRQNEALHEQRNVTMAKFRALACGHEPGDPYTTLTPEREQQLLRERLTDLEGKS